MRAAWVGTEMPAEAFAQAGFLRVPDVLTAAECERIALIVPPPEGAGSRCLLAEPWCQALALRLQRHGVLAALLPAGHVAVQCNYFEKSATRNWLIPIHQDLSVPVAERRWTMNMGGKCSRASQALSRPNFPACSVR